MIEPDLEHPRSAAAATFFDAVSLDFCDGERGIFGLVRIARRPAADRTQLLAVVCADGETLLREGVELDRSVPDWDAAEVDGARMTTAVPLESWSLELERAGVSLALSAHATSPAFPHQGAGTGIEGYEQLCDITGSVDAGDRLYPLHCGGRRRHLSGELDWSKLRLWRSLYAASTDGLEFSVTSARPAGASGHGDELRAARLHGELETASGAIEDVRLSTVYGADGMPAKAGLELVLAEDELPLRFGATAVCSTSVELGDEIVGVTFMRWSIEGAPAFGCYESRAPR
jgi:hypothetical protein